VSVLGLDGKIRVEPAPRRMTPTRCASRIRSARSRSCNLRTAAGSTIRRSSSNISTPCRRRPHHSEGHQARFEALRLEALADGILDASILQVYEGAIARPRSTSRSGSTCRPARLRAGSQLLRPHPRSSTRRPMSARSRSPACSATATSVSKGAGARTPAPGRLARDLRCARARLCRDHAAAVVTATCPSRATRTPEQQKAPVARAFFT